MLIRVSTPSGVRASLLATISHLNSFVPGQDKIRTSNTSCGPDSDINCSFLGELIASLNLYRAVDGTDYSVARIRECGRTICLWQVRQARFGVI